MALHGTLDTFALTDVLRLLASTRKTGRLRVVTARATGDVWVAVGDVVGSSIVDDGGAAAERAAGDDPGEVLFELLRSPAGSFVFAAGEEPAVRDEPRPVEPLLLDAEARLAEWRAIEAVVPSLEAWVSLRAALPGPEVTIDAALWALVVAVGAGARVGEVGGRLGLGEVAVSSAVKVLVEAGLAAVDDAVAGQGAAGAAAAEDDLAADLVSLSPEAAEAVAVAAMAVTDEQHEAVLAGAVDEHEARLDRSVLLRFLSSVR